MNDFEIEILANKDKLCFIDNLIKVHQFSEEFLIKTSGYYDSWQILKFQKNLSPYFCFRYLYDIKTDSADNWTDYNDIVRYLQKYNLNITNEEIEIEFNKAMINRTMN